MNILKKYNKLIEKNWKGHQSFTNEWIYMSRFEVNYIILNRFLLLVVLLIFFQNIALFFLYIIWIIIII